MEQTSNKMQEDMRGEMRKTSKRNGRTEKLDIKK